MGRLYSFGVSEAAVTVQPVRLLGDPILRARADEVSAVDEDVRQLVADLTDTMQASGGVGMAAPQIGVGRRVFVYDTTAAEVPEEERAGGALVNPSFEVIDDAPQTGAEGCLSIPGLRYHVTRPLRVRARGLDASGVAVQFEAQGLLARCVQHEIDHLDGVLYLDRLEPAVRKQAMRAVRETAWFSAGRTVMPAEAVLGSRVMGDGVAMGQPVAGQDR